jgi:hypothetical protein
MCLICVIHVINVLHMHGYHVIQVQDIHYVECTGVLHMYDRCINYICNTPKTPHMHYKCITCVLYEIRYQSYYLLLI